MNELDSQIISGLLAQHGYVMVEDEAAADALLFNTCSVRDLSERKVLGKLGTLRHGRARRPELVLGVCGCMAELSGERLLRKQPHVDFVCGTNSAGSLPRLLAQAFTRRLASAQQTKHNGAQLERLRRAFQSNGDARAEADLPALLAALGFEAGKAVDELVARRPQPWQAFVAVMRGCSNFCSFCVVPHARGPEVSRPADEIVAEIEELAARGCSEVVLLGQNVNSYGRRGQTPGATFAALLRRVNAIAGIRWIRFLTSNPQDISADLIAAIGSCEKVCHQMHFPLQSGSDRILKLMNRKYTCAEYLGIVEKIRAAAPDMAFSTDIIVGFPTETDEDVADTARAMRAAGFASGYIFKYSPRPGTKAAELADDVPVEVKKARHQTLLALQNELTFKAHQGLVDTTQLVLAEGPSKTDTRMLRGRTATHFNVVFPGAPEYAGRFITVRITRATPLTLYGETST